jgi:hypothetical protein
VPTFASISAIAHYPEKHLNPSAAPLKARPLAD